MTPLTRNAALTIAAVPATTTKRWCAARAWRSASIKVWMTEEFHLGPDGGGDDIFVGGAIFSIAQGLLALRSGRCPA